MENDKNKSREPFKPENTPQPPQVMDTSKAPQNDAGRSKEKPSNDAGDNGEKRNADKKSSQDTKGKKKLLGESPIEIDDETTI